MLTDGKWTQVFAHANGVGCDGLSALMDLRNSRSAVKPRDGRSQKPWLQTATKASQQQSSLTGAKGRSETTRCLTFRDARLWLFGKCKAICGPAPRPTGRLEENY